MSGIPVSVAVSPFGRRPFVRNGRSTNKYGLDGVRFPQSFFFKGGHHGYQHHCHSLSPADVQVFILRHEQKRRHLEVQQRLARIEEKIGLLSLPNIRSEPELHSVNPPGEDPSSAHGPIVYLGVAGIRILSPPRRRQAVPDAPVHDYEGLDPAPARPPCDSSGDVARRERVH